MARSLPMNAFTEVHTLLFNIHPTFFSKMIYIQKKCKQESKSNHKITINQFTNSKRWDVILYP